MMVKVAALIAALGFVTLMLEQPRLTAWPSRPRATVEQSLQPAHAGGAPVSRFASEADPPDVSRLPASASEPLPIYFPGQFPLPNGEIDPQPTGF